MSHAWPPARPAFLITVDEALNDVYNKAETGAGYAYLSLNPTGAPPAVAAVLCLRGKLAAKGRDWAACTA